MIPGDPLSMKNMDGTLSSVLRNRFGINNQAKLDALEVKFGRIRADQLARWTENGSIRFDNLFDRATKTHYHLFHDIYDWAGKTREVNVAKRNPATGEVTRFAEIKALGNNPSRLTPQNRLDAEREFADQFRLIEAWMATQDMRSPRALAEMYAKLNVLHPFRDGNGRVNKEIIRQVALEHGLKFSLPDTLSKQQWIDASIRGNNGNHLSMSRIIGESLEPIPGWNPPAAETPTSSGEIKTERRIDQSASRER